MTEGSKTRASSNSFRGLRHTQNCPGASSPCAAPALRAAAPARTSLAGLLDPTALRCGGPRAAHGRAAAGHSAPAPAPAGESSSKRVGGSRLMGPLHVLPLGSRGGGVWDHGEVPGSFILWLRRQVGRPWVTGSRSPLALCSKMTEVLDRQVRLASNSFDLYAPASAQATLPSQPKARSHSTGKPPLTLLIQKAYRKLTESLRKAGELKNATEASLPVEGVSRRPPLDHH